MKDLMQEFDELACPSFEIAAYIDGELSPEREQELDLHFVECDTCSDELREQKQFLCTLNSSLMNENEIELPADFTRTIVANAESSVAGLRRPRERYNALLICLALFLLGSIALAASSGETLARILAVIDTIGAVAGFVGQVVYSVFVGFGILMRTLSGQSRIPEAVSLVSVILFSVIFISLSRRLIRFRRT